MAGAMIFGADAVATPDPVSLPTDTDNWFTDGNGTTVNGTQVPSYWVNKLGGEIGALIAAFTTLSMTNTEQLAEALSFASELAVPGYQKLPNGLIIQWGNAALNNGGSWQETVEAELALAWPNGFLIGVCTDSYVDPKPYTCSAGSNNSNVTILCKKFYLNGDTGDVVDRSTLSAYTLGFWIAVGF